MPRLRLSVPDEAAEALKCTAAGRGMSLSVYLSVIMSKEINSESWAEGFFQEVLDGRKGELERTSQGSYEERDRVMENAG